MPSHDNREIWDLLCLASTQWRVGFGGAYAFDYSAVVEMAEALQITIDRLFFEKIRTYETEVLKIWKSKKGNKDEGPCNDAQKEKCTIEFPEFLEWACKQCERNPGRDIEDHGTE